MLCVPRSASPAVRWHRVLGTSWDANVAMASTNPTNIGVSHWLTRIINLLERTTGRQYRATGGDPSTDAQQRDHHPADRLPDGPDHAGESTVEAAPNTHHCGLRSTSAGRRRRPPPSPRPVRPSPSVVVPDTVTGAPDRLAPPPAPRRDVADAGRVPDHLDRDVADLETRRPYEFRGRYAGTRHRRRRPTPARSVPRVSAQITKSGRRTAARRRRHERPRRRPSDRQAGHAIPQQSSHPTRLIVRVGVHIRTDADPGCVHRPRLPTRAAVTAAGSVPTRRPLPPPPWRCSGHSTIGGQKLFGEDQVHRTSDLQGGLRTGDPEHLVRPVSRPGRHRRCRRPRPHDVRPRGRRAGIPAVSCTGAAGPTGRGWPPRDRIRRPA